MKTILSEVVVQVRVVGVPEAVAEILRMSPRCSTCRWWRGNGPSGECRLAVTASRPEAFPASKALAYGAGIPARGGRLETAADFGCVQWERTKALSEVVL